MNTTKSVFAACIAFSMLGTSPTAVADDVDCPPDLGAVTIDGNVLVAADCTLSGTVVKGNVHVYSGGTLTVQDDARIDGNIQAENAFDVNVRNSEVGGSIQLDDLVGDGSSVVGSVVGGSIQLKSNRAPLDIDDNDVGADIQAFSNSGGVDITGNTVDGNLQCKSNQPAPTGGNNTVHGNKEDQCESLSAGSPPSGGASPGSNAAGASDAGASGAGAAGPLLLAILGLLVAGLRRRPT